MKLFLTGATGFIGREVAAQAVRRGYEVIALARDLRAIAPEARPSEARAAATEARAIPADTHATHAEAIPDEDRATPATADAIIHLAPTTDGMEPLIAAAPYARFVLISSLAVYDILSLADHARLDEHTPLQTRPAGPYAATKLAQEELARRLSQNLTILRPGIVHGQGREWFHHLGMQLTPRRWLCLAPESPLPLISLEHCAAAILDALDAPPTTRNLIDEDPPRRGEYVAALAARTTPRPAIHTLSWPTLKRFASLGLGSLHDLFHPARLATRCKPLRYS